MEIQDKDRNKINPESNKSSSDNLPKARNHLSENGLSMTLIDRTKINYEDFEQALNITKSQINTILKFNKEKEISSYKFLEEQLQNMNNMLANMNDYKSYIQEEKAKVTKTLETFLDFQKKYTGNPTKLDEDLKLMSMDIEEYESTQNKITEEINQKTFEMNSIIKEFNQNIFNKVQASFNHEHPSFAEILSIFVGILLLKEQATKEEVYQVYSTFENFSRLFTSFKYENLTIESSKNILQKIDTIAKESPVKNKPDDSQIQAMKTLFVHYIKIVSELSIITQNYRRNEKNIQKIKDISKTQNEKGKGCLILEIKLLMDQINSFNEIIQILEDNINRKNNEIAYVYGLQSTISQSYNKDLIKEIDEETKIDFYKKDEETKKE